MRVVRALFAAAAVFAALLAVVHLVWLGWVARGDDWVFLAPGLLAGILAADLATGFVHWACDTWGGEETPHLGPHLIRSFREHHTDPLAMLEHDWVEVNGEAATASAACLVLLTLPASRQALEGQPFVHASLWSLICFSALANQLHWWAHCPRPPRAVRLFQRYGLILSASHHAQHHRAPHTSHYCISTGWLNAALDAVRFWRVLERSITWVTGAQPRRTDARAYGRSAKRAT